MLCVKMFQLIKKFFKREKREIIWNNNNAIEIVTNGKNVKSYTLYKRRRSDLSEHSIS